MREILFRGKRIRPDSDTGKIEWVYGLYMTVYGTPNIELEDGRECDVDAETVGQYTGLTDKNGTRIFEGDILKIVDDEGNTDFSDGGVGNVEFAYGLWYVSGKPQNGLWDLLQAYYCEVIGNIHDNPELLEEREENE